MGLLTTRKAVQEEASAAPKRDCVGSRVGKNRNARRSLMSANVSSEKRRCAGDGAGCRQTAHKRDDISRRLSRGSRVGVPASAAEAAGATPGEGPSPPVVLDHEEPSRRLGRPETAAASSLERAAESRIAEEVRAYFPDMNSCRQLRLTGSNAGVVASPHSAPPPLTPSPGQQQPWASQGLSSPSRKRQRYSLLAALLSELEERDRAAAAITCGSASDNGDGLVDGSGVTGRAKRQRRETHLTPIRDGTIHSTAAAAAVRTVPETAGHSAKACAGTPTHTFSSASMVPRYAVECVGCESRVTFCAKASVLSGQIVLWARSVVTARVRPLSGGTAPDAARPASAASPLSPTGPLAPAAGAGKTGVVDDALRAVVARALALPPLLPVHARAQILERQSPSKAVAGTSLRQPGEGGPAVSAAAVRRSKHKSGGEAALSPPDGETLRLAYESLHLVSEDVALRPRASSFAIQSIVQPGRPSALECYPKHMINFGLLLYALSRVSEAEFARCVDGAAPAAAAPDPRLLRRLRPSGAGDAVLVLGLGGNALAACLDRLLPPAAPIDVVEIEPAVVEACRRAAQVPLPLTPFTPCDIQLGSAADAAAAAASAAGVCTAPTQVGEEEGRVPSQEPRACGAAEDSTTNLSPKGLSAPAASVERRLRGRPRKAPTDACGAFVGSSQSPTDADTDKALSAPSADVPKVVKFWVATAAPAAASCPRAERYRFYTGDAYDFLRHCRADPATPDSPIGGTAFAAADSSSGGKTSTARNRGSTSTVNSTRQQESSPAARAAPAAPSPPSRRYAMIFLDCYDPSRETMLLDEDGLLSLCQSRLRPGGLLLVNAHVLPSVAALQRHGFLPPADTRQAPPKQRGRSRPITAKRNNRRKSKESSGAGEKQDAPGSPASPGAPPEVAPSPPPSAIVPFKSVHALRVAGCDQCIVACVMPGGNDSDEEDNNNEEGEEKEKEGNRSTDSCLLPQGTLRRTQAADDADLGGGGHGLHKSNSSRNIASSSQGATPDDPGVFSPTSSSSSSFFTYADSTASSLASPTTSVGGRARTVRDGACARGCLFTLTNAKRMGHFLNRHVYGRPRAVDASPTGGCRGGCDDGNATGAWSGCAGDGGGRSEDGKEDPDVFQIDTEWFTKSKVATNRFGADVRLWEHSQL